MNASARDEKTRLVVTERDGLCCLVTMVESTLATERVKLKAAAGLGWKSRDPVIAGSAFRYRMSARQCQAATVTWLPRAPAGGLKGHESYLTWFSYRQCATDWR